MKSGSFRVTVLAIVLASPMLTFAGGQPNKVRNVSKTELQARSGIARTVNQGKGAGMSRNQQAAVPAHTATTPRPSGSETAFTK
jgi:hypothetical protein